MAAPLPAGPGGSLQGPPQFIIVNNQPFLVTPGGTFLPATPSGSPAPVVAPPPAPAPLSPWLTPFTAGPYAGRTPADLQDWMNLPDGARHPMDSGVDMRPTYGPPRPDEPYVTPGTTQRTQRDPMTVTMFSLPVYDPKTNTVRLPGGQTVTLGRKPYTRPTIRPRPGNVVMPRPTGVLNTPDFYTPFRIPGLTIPGPEPNYSRPPSYGYPDAPWWLQIILGPQRNVTPRRPPRPAGGGPPPVATTPPGGGGIAPPPLWNVSSPDGQYGVTIAPVSPGAPVTGDIVTTAAVVVGTNLPVTGLWSVTGPGINTTFDAQRIIFGPVFAGFYNLFVVVTDRDGGQVTHSSLLSVS